MNKEDLLNEMYLLLKKFDENMLQLMNLFRENGELQDEIIVGNLSQFGESIDTTTKPFNAYNTMMPLINVGDIFVGIVVRILDFGAFVEFASGKDGMIHISKLSEKGVKNVEDIVKIGDKVKVEIIKIDDKGRIDLKLIEKVV